MRTRTSRVPGARVHAGPRRSTAPPLLVATVVQRRRAADLRRRSPDECGLPKSTTSRLLTALERAELLERDDDRRRTSPGRCSGSTPPGTTRGEELVAARPARRWRAIGEEHRRDGQPRGPRAATGGAGRPGRRDATSSGRRDWTGVDVPPTARRSARSSTPTARCRRPTARSSAAPTATADRPRRALAASSPLSAAGLGDARSTSSRSGSPASPSRCTAATAAWSPRSAISGPTHAGSPTHLAATGCSSLDHAHAHAALRPTASAHSNHRTRRSGMSTRGDPQGSVRRDAGRQRPARARADPRGRSAMDMEPQRCCSTR